MECAIAFSPRTVAMEEIEEQIKQAIAFHLEGLREEGLPIPEPTSLCHS